MINADLVLIHGFWSKASTWDKLAGRMQVDSELQGLRVHRFGYESPKLSVPFSWTRIPDYDDIAQSLASYLYRDAVRGETAIVTHSQGGLILQRLLAWMLHEGRGEELARIKLIVMLACPNEGSEYLRSIRAAARFGRHPQARDLRALSADVSDARRTVLTQVVHAKQVTPRECPIPIHTYSGRTDKVVPRGSAQAGFLQTGVLPGNHFSVLDPEAPQNITFPTLKDHLLETFSAEAGTADGPTRRAGAAGTADPKPSTGSPTPAAPASGPKYQVTVDRSKGVQIGDHNTQHNTY